MPESGKLGVFVAASLALLLAPGPAVLYIVARSLEQGRLAGLCAAAGMNVGGLVHVALAAAGLAAAAVASPLALAGFRALGGAYLVWLGLRTLAAALRHAGAAILEGSRPRTRGLGRIFRESIVVNLLNPKALLFFLAFLPQFADPARGRLGPQLAALGLVFIALAVVTDAAWALVAGSAASWLAGRPGVARGQRVVAGLALLGLGLFAALGAVPPVVDARLNRTLGGEAAPSERARRVHATVDVVDLHADTLLWDRPFLTRSARGHVDLPRLVEGRVALQVFAATTRAPAGMSDRRNADRWDRVTPLVVAQAWPPRTWTSALERALYQAARLHELARRSEGRLVVVRTRADLDELLAARAGGSAPVGGLLAIEGAHALEGDLANLDALFDAGYRMIGLAHFFDTELAGSAHGVRAHGLTELGRRAVARMEELGLTIDLAHAAPRAIDDVLAVARRPVVVSHTGVRATCDGPRNLADRHVDAIAARGGVIGIALFRGAVCDTGLDAAVRAMRHVAGRVGVEHVALGSDFDGAVATAIDAAGLAALTGALFDGGFTEAEIRAILGGNATRVLRANLPRRPAGAG